MTEFEEQALMRRVVAEMRIAADEPEIPLLLTADAALCLIAELQLALRHPGNTGKSAKVSRDVVDSLIRKFRELDYFALAELAEKGNQPEHDTWRCTHCGAHMRPEEADSHQCKGASA